MSKAAPRATRPGCKARRCPPKSAGWESYLDWIAATCPAEGKPNCRCNEES